MPDFVFLHPLLARHDKLSDIPTDHFYIKFDAREPLMISFLSLIPSHRYLTLLRIALAVPHLISSSFFIQAPSLIAADSWTSFQNGGQLKHSQLPASWDASATGIAWQASIDGYGQSSPIVHNDHVYITSTSGPNKEKYHLAAFSLGDGKKLWQRDFDNPSPEENNSYVSRAASSPVADSSGVIASFEGGLIVALDHSGEPRWSKNLVNEYGSVKTRHGLAASLEQDDNHVYVWIERESEPYVLSLAKTDGSVRWKSVGVGATSWSSPRLINVDGQPQLVCSASGHIAAYEPSTGAKLWDFTDIANNTTCTPIPVGDGEFFIGASDGRGEQGAGKTAASNGLIKIQKQADGSFLPQYVWRAEKATCSFGSPIIANNCVWLVNRAGVLFQLDLATGKQLSAERVSCGSVWATPLASSDKLYLFGQKGTTSIVSLSDAKEISQATTWEDSQANLAAREGAHVLYAVAATRPYLLIRRGDKLFAVKSEAN